MATITTLIPAFKTEYLAEVFLGLARQSCQDFRVVVGDDSPGEVVSELILGGHFGDLVKRLDLTVLRGPKNLRLNQRALLAHWGGSSPFVHLHLDDDLIYPDFYRQHLAAHAGGRYCATVSRRWFSHDDTRPVHGVSLPDFVERSPLRVVPLGADELIASTVPRCWNWLGEFSNMLLSAEGLQHWPRGSDRDISYFGLPDIGFLLTASQHLPVACLREHLGVFRQHAEQTTHHMRHHGGRVSALSWAACALQAWQEQRISPAQAVQAITQTVKDCLERFGEGDDVANQFFDLVQHRGHSLAELHAHFTPFWQALVASHPSTAPAGLFPEPTLAPLSAPADAEALPA